LNNPNKGLPMSSRQGNKSLHPYGTIPKSMDEARSVTTEVADGPYRSVGVVGNMHTPFIEGPSLSLMPPTLSRDPQYGAPKPKYRPDPFCDSFSSEEIKPESNKLSSTSWNVDDLNLNPKPDFYPLEQTATFVPHCKPSEVASRVADFLLERNVNATFNGLKAKAKCVSKDNVEFNVRLYKGQKQFDHGVIVEVQRRYGFSVYYHRDAIGILDAAEGKVPLEPLEEPSFHFPEAEKCARTQLIY